MVFDLWYVIMFITKNEMIAFILYVMAMLTYSATKKNTHLLGYNVVELELVEIISMHVLKQY